MIIKKINRWIFTGIAAGRQDKHALTLTETFQKIIEMQMNVWGDGKNILGEFDANILTSFF